MHEVGHTLGLRHNFKASSTSNLKDLNNTEITRKQGVVASVMDYAPDAAIAEDYRNIAGWLRSLSPPATQGFRKTRWSER